MSNSDVERLLCGKLPQDKALTPLAPMISAFHNVNWPAPTEEAVARFAQEAAAVARVGPSGATPAPPYARRKYSLTPVLQRGLATGLATLLLISGLAGVAVASDDAAPGDLLYGIDRALESVGVGAGGASERIAEAWALFERGQMAEAVSHASRAVGVGTGELTDQLYVLTISDSDSPHSAAKDLNTGSDGGTSAEVRAAVAAMLDEMAAMLEDPTLEGKEFGQSIAALARLIGVSNSPLGSGEPSAPPGKGTPGPAGDPPVDAPGKSDDAPGKSESSPGSSDKNQENTPNRP